jgi:hypothetical protein
MYNKVNIKIKYSHTHAHTYKQLVKNFYFRIEKSNRNPTSKLENSSLHSRKATSTSKTTRQPESRDDPPVGNQDSG